MNKKFHFNYRSPLMRLRVDLNSGQLHTILFHFHLSCYDRLSVNDVTLLSAWYREDILHDCAVHYLLRSVHLR